MEKCKSGYPEEKQASNGAGEKQIDQLVYLSAKALASADKLYGLPPETGRHPGGD